MKPIVYVAGPEVFNTARDDCAFATAWAERHNFMALHPKRDPFPSTIDGIFDRCVQDTMDADAVLLDYQPFRGVYPDVGTVFESGVAYACLKLAFQQRKLLLAYAPEAVDPVKCLPDTQAFKDGLSIDNNKYVIDPCMWNAMLYCSVKKSGGDFFFGAREHVFENMATYIKGAFKI